MLKILQPGPTDGGTRYGSSLYRGGLTCPKRAMHMFEKFEYGVDDFGEGALAVGSYFHKFMELYYTNSLPDEPILAGDLGGNEDAIEAFRLFRWYTGKFGRDDFGQVIGAEVGVLEDNPHWKRVDEALGVPFTAKVDLVVRAGLDNVRRLNDLGCHLSTPGVYLVDFKTRGRRDRLAQAKYDVDLQALAYPVAYNAVAEAAGEEPCRGMIFIEIFKTKEPGASFFFVPLAEGEKLSGLQTTMRNARRLLDTGMANPTACFAYNRECSLLTEKLCKGY